MYAVEAYATACKRQHGLIKTEDTLRLLAVSIVKDTAFTERPLLKNKGALGAWTFASPYSVKVYFAYSPVAWKQIIVIRPDVVGLLSELLLRYLSETDTHFPEGPCLSWRAH